MPSYGKAVLAVAVLAALGLVVLVPGVMASEPAGSRAGPGSESVDVTAFTIPYRQLEIASIIAGVLGEVHVEEGDEVEAGQVLAQLRADIMEAQVAVAQARVEAAEYELTGRIAHHEMLEEDFARADSLHDQGVMSDREHAEAELKMVLARYAVETAKAAKQVQELEFQQSKAELDLTVLRAPIDGDILRIEKNVGEAVERYSPVLTMVSVDPLYVVAYVPVATAGRIKPGMRAMLTLENRPGDELKCSVAVVDKVADVASGTYRIKLTLPNPEKSITAGAKGTLSLTLAAQPR
jgi:RND family efflux transporter MFP subunit